MSYTFPPDIAQLIARHLTAGHYTSEDEVLRDALITLSQFELTAEQIDEEYRQTVEAVKKGLVDLESGRVKPLRSIIDSTSQSNKAD